METPINLQPYLLVQTERLGIEKRTGLEPVPSCAVDFGTECEQVAKVKGSDQDDWRAGFRRAKESTAVEIQFKGPIQPGTSIPLWDALQFTWSGV